MPKLVKEYNAEDVDDGGEEVKNVFKGGDSDEVGATVIHWRSDLDEASL